MKQTSESTGTVGPSPVIRAAWVYRDQADTFRVFTDEIGAWWPLPTHGLFGAKAGGVAFRNDRLVEISTDGTQSVWGEVRVWDPPCRLVISWHPGREPSESSEVEVTFVEDHGGTRVILEHRGWEAFGTDAKERRRSYVGPNAWGYVLDHFADGAETQLDAVDLTKLAAAYDEFFTEYEAGNFGDPLDGGWDADQVLAHVTLNDAAMLAVCQSIVHDGDLRFENALCQDREVLAKWIDTCRDRRELVALGRQGARQVIAALARLSAEQRDTNVHCRLQHEGDIVLNNPRPWGSVAIDVQLEVHLPAHKRQLQDLRR